jgi:hypothetical protein
MDIRYHGKESITIKNKSLEILVGIDFPLAKKINQRLLLANPSKTGIDFGSVPEDKVLIIGPGDYEVGGVDVSGSVYGEKKVFYLLIIDGFKVGVMFEDGAIKEIGEKVDSLDVLILLNPLAGLDKKLVSLTKRAGNNFLILVGEKQDYKDVLDAFDREDIVATDKFSLKAGEELAEGMEVVLISKT